MEDGTVGDSTVLRIANKIANGEQLTREEEAMRQEVSQRVEDKLRIGFLLIHRVEMQCRFLEPNHRANSNK